MNDIVISSEAQFREELKKIDFDKAGLLYRGQADANWPVNCSAVRRLARDLADPVESRLTNSLLVGYLEFLIAKARTRNVLPHGFDTASPDLELLALLQHQGAATGLIDFTLQPFVALWFASNGSQTEDGAVYLLSRASTTEISDRSEIKRPLGSLYEKNVLWSWEPSAPGRLHLNWVRTSKCSRILFQVGVRHREMYERWHVDGEFNLSRRLRA